MIREKLVLPRPVARVRRRLARAGELDVGGLEGLEMKKTKLSFWIWLTSKVHKMYV